MFIEIWNNKKHFNRYFPGTYGVHRIFVSHARHLGHITAPHKKILIWSDAFSSYKLPEVMEDSFHIYEQCDVSKRACIIIH